MNRSVYIVLGHPQSHSFDGRIADAYETRLRALGHEVRRQNIGDLTFDPILHWGYGKRMELEPDLLWAQENLKWCDELVLIYPMWWGNFPALLKGFFDRMLLPGFAFKYHKKDPFWDKYLRGKTARLIRTSDSPSIYAKFAYHDADFQTLKSAILGFVGIKIKQYIRVGQVRNLNDAQKQAAIDRIVRKIK